MQKTIAKLWNEELLPIKDGLYFADGNALSLRIACAPTPAIDSGDWFDVSGFHEANQDEVAHIDTVKEVPLSNGNFIRIGGGGYGSEGFIAYLDSQQRLIWVLYAESSNPFVNAVERDDGMLIVDSSADFKLRIDIHDPASLSLC